MSVPFGTPLLSRPIAAIGLPAALPCIVSRPGLFPDIRPVSTLLMTDYPLLYLPCPGIPFLGIRPPRPRPSPSLLVPSRPFSSPPLYLSRPEKGLQKRVNLMQQKTNSDLSRHYLPRQLRHLILQEYLSGVKTARQLSEEHGIPMSTIHKMGQRWKAKNSCSFVSTPNPYPIMSRVTSEEASELLSENKALRRRLEEALLRLEGYEIMGDILQEDTVSTC